MLPFKMFTSFTKVIFLCCQSASLHLRFLLSGCKTPCVIKPAKIDILYDRYSQLYEVEKINFAL